MKKITGSTLVIITLFFVTACSKTKHYELSRFVSPEICGGCHKDIYSQWKNSMHNLSHVDPAYLKVSNFLLKGLTDADQIKEAESCVKCHTPLGFVSRTTMKTSEESKAPEIAKKGIQCDYCHSATGAYQLYNNGITLKPGNGENDPGIKRGPFKDSKSSYHENEYSEFHTESEICGTCHDVRHVVYGTKLETTYEEWKNSPYNSDNPSKKITCQGCHMYQRPGIPATASTDRPKNPGTAASGGPRRDHIFTHYFVGGNSYIPGKFNDSLKPAMAEERLKNAAEVSIPGYDIQKGELTINIKNIGAGHNLPTGLTDTRQMWLEIKVRDKNKKIIFSSGVPADDGTLPENSIIFNTIFGDGNGRPVINIAKAKEILKDKRILPLKSVNETIKLPGANLKSIEVQVKLQYRSVPQKLLDMIDGKGKIIFPIITMAEANKVF